MSSPSPDVSVIIPCYNGAETLPDQLRALARQEYRRPWELIVADNASTDHLPEIISSFREELPQLRLVDASGRQGGAYARNVGVEASRADRLLFCDADDVVGATWLSALASALDAHDFVAGSLEWHRLNPDWTLGDREGGQSNELYRIGKYRYGATCNLGVRRDAFLAVEGFNETLDNLIDVDFCLRVQKQGIPITFVPEAVVHYRTRHELKKAFVQARGYAKHNTLLRVSHDISSAPHPWKHFVRQAPHQLRGLLGIRSKEELHRWVWRFGWFVGVLQGAVQAERKRPEPTVEDHGLVQA